MNGLARTLKALLLICVALGMDLHAQNTEALRQTFHAPKADVEQALKDLNAYQSGRIPFVEGFVGSIDEPLAGFQRPSYQYTIVVQQVSDSEVSVSVNAKISAWYEDKDAAKSGYRDLPSNGRLEADLLDRLRGRLRQHSAEIASSRTPLVSPRLMGITPAAEPPAAAPAAPSAAVSPSVPNFRNYAAPAATPPTGTPEQNARYQRLVQEEKSLTEVLAAQQHPNDLVAVKSPHTPIVSTPAAASRVVMYADAEDEFQFLKTEGEIAAAPAAATEAFHQTKEETSQFPGEWAPLRGKNVKIIWVQPTGKTSQKARLSYAESIFKAQAPQIISGIDGVVIVFDAAEGGMAATTVAALQQWGAGSLSDTAFLKQCWFDPVDAFVASTR
jgi:hypothetical protein